MQIASMPKYIDPASLTITRQRNVDDNPLHTEIHAVDAEGDSFTVSRQQEDTGMTCVTADVDLTVQYQQAGAEPEKPRGFGEQEAGDLYMALSDAKKADGLDEMAGMWIMADLRSQGGIGGAMGGFL